MRAGNRTPPPATLRLKVVAWLAAEGSSKVPDAVPPSENVPPVTDQVSVAAEAAPFASPINAHATTQQRQCIIDAHSSVRAHNSHTNATTPRASLASNRVRPSATLPLRSTRIPAHRLALRFAISMPLTAVRRASEPRPSLWAARWDPSAHHSADSRPRDRAAAGVCPAVVQRSS